MAKELPYFRFTVQEWQNGDIGIESYELKGLFIDVCGFYWVKDCDVTVLMLEKKFSNARILLEQLISLDIIKVDMDGNVSVDFLNEQYDLLSQKRKNRQLAGQKGGLSKSSNARILLEQNASYKDKDKDKDNNNNKDPKKSFFAVDANVSEIEYKKYLFKCIGEKQSSRETLFMQNKIDLSLRNQLWEAFVKNGIVESPQIEDERHAWNCFKRFVKENATKYQVKLDRNPK